MEKKVDIFLIFVLNVLQVQKAISYHLLDEVSEGVQPTSLERIQAILEGLNQQEKTTIFLVEQNIRFALSLADDYLVMKQGRIVVQGSVDSPDAGERIERAIAV